MNSIDSRNELDPNDQVRINAHTFLLRSRQTRTSPPCKCVASVRSCSGALISSTSSAETPTSSICSPAACTCELPPGPRCSTCGPDQQDCRRTAYMEGRRAQTCRPRTSPQVQPLRHEPLSERWG